MSTKNERKEDLKIDQKKAEGSKTQTTPSIWYSWRLEKKEKACWI